MKHTLLTVLLLLTHVLVGQQIGDTLSIVLERHIGPGPFSQSMSMYKPNPTDTSHQYYYLHERATGLPEAYSDFGVGSMPTDFRQMAYSAIKNGVLDSASYFGGWFGDDTPEQLAQLTAQKVDTEVSLAYGKIGEKHYLIVDKNNDEDFTNEKVIELGAASLDFKGFGDPELFSAQVERYIKSDIIKDTVYFAFMPVESMGRTFTNPSEYRSGSVMLEGKEVSIYVNNSFYGIQYTPNTLNLIYLDRPYNKGDERANRDSYLSVNDYIKGQSFDYQIADIDLQGKELKLIVAEHKERKGTGIGQVAPDLEGWLLNNSLYKVKAGNTTMIDFWGTWCAPCVAEVPYLKDAHQAFKGEGFQLVSVANDSKEKVQSFVEKNDMSWHHMMESDAGSAVKDFRVDGYPSTFLLGDDLTILQKENNLRGKKLLLTLAAHYKLSREEVQERLSKGNLVIKVNAPEVVSLSLTSDFSTGVANLYNWSEDGSWKKGFEAQPGEYELKFKVIKSGETRPKEVIKTITVGSSDQQVIEVDLGEL